MTRKILRTLAMLLLPLAMTSTAALGKSSSDPIDEVTALLTEAYIVGGWSDRDATLIAEIKAQRMIDREHDGDIPDFVPLDHIGELSEGSDGVAVIDSLLVRHHGWAAKDASFHAWVLYAKLNDWSMGLELAGDLGDEEDPDEDEEDCVAYLVTYQYCVNAQLRTRQVYWNSPCFVQRFIMAPCVNIPDCECPEGWFCGIEYVPIGNCRGVGAGTCMRLTEARLVSVVDCTRIIDDFSGGCEDCIPPQSIGTDCPDIIAANCYLPDCPGCGT